MKKVFILTLVAVFTSSPGIAKQKGLPGDSTKEEAKRTAYERILDQCWEYPGYLDLSDFEYHGKYTRKKWKPGVKVKENSGEDNIKYPTPLPATGPYLK